MSAANEQRRPTGRLLLPLILFVILAFEIYLLVCVLKCSWYNKIGAVTAMVGIYGIGMGFFSKNKEMQKFSSILDDLTSPNVNGFIAGNMYTMAIIWALIATAMNVSRSRTAPWYLKYFGSVAISLLSGLLFVFTLAYIVIIMPIVYLPILFSSLLIQTIDHAPNNIWFSYGEASIILKEIVTKNRAAARGFIMGVPSIGLSIWAKIIVPLFFTS